jgi:uncharacterized protein
MQENMDNKNCNCSGDCSCGCANGGSCHCHSGGGFGHFRWFGKTALLMLSLFLLVVSIKEYKSLSYVGAGIAPTNVISVSGKGEVVGIPDIATFSFSVQAESKVVAEAQSASAKKINAIMDFLKKSGIDQKDIQTSGYNIYPRYDYAAIEACPVYSSYCPPGKQVLAAYVVSQSIMVKIRKTGDAGTILSGVGGLGATDVSGLSFTFDKQDDLANQARSKAITDAKTKAATLAGELGVRLVRITSYSEGGSYPPIYYAKADMMATGVGGAAPTPEIPVGENKVTSNVTITYEVR